MKSLKNWRLVEPGNRKVASGRRHAFTKSRGEFTVLRGAWRDLSRGSHSEPGLADRINRISTYILAYRTFNSFRFGGTYDRA